MIDDKTARGLRSAVIRFHAADAELRAGKGETRRGVVALATEYVQARRDLAKRIERAEHEEQALDEGQ